MIQNKYLSWMTLVKIYIHKNEKQDAELQAFKNRITILMCVNVDGFVI